MRLERLELTDFRNHPTVALDLPPGVSALVGPNGVGKTSLIEAIGYLATLGSHRLGQDSALVRSGTQAAVIRARAARAGRKILVELEIRPGSGVRGRVNHAPVPRPRDLLGMIRAVVFAPEDLALVRGDPEERRRFLDTLAVQRLPRYHAVRHDYDRILRQRNTLLRSAGGRMPSGSGVATLDVWDEKLARAGASLWAERLQLVALLAPRVEQAYRQLAARTDDVEVAYASSVSGRELPHGEPPATAPAAPQARLGSPAAAATPSGSGTTHGPRPAVTVRTDALAVPRAPERNSPHAPQAGAPSAPVGPAGVPRVATGPPHPSAAATPSGAEARQAAPPIRPPTLAEPQGREAGAPGPGEPPGGAGPASGGPGGGPDGEGGGAPDLGGRSDAGGPASGPDAPLGASGGAPGPSGQPGGGGDRELVGATAAGQGGDGGAGTVPAEPGGPTARPPADGRSGAGAEDLAPRPAATPVGSLAGQEGSYGGGAGSEPGPGATAGPVPRDVSASAPDPAVLTAVLLARLTADRAREIERGVTLSGPHRDDVSLGLQGMPARTHASHGEAWSLALALRLASYRLLTEEGEEPILLLDDVFAELDRHRRDQVAAVALAAEQAVITVAVLDDLPSHLRSSMFHVEPGQITSERDG